jgi:aminopeptidase N
MKRSLPLHFILLLLLSACGDTVSPAELKPTQVQSIGSSKDVIPVPAGSESATLQPDQDQTLTPTPSELETRLDLQAQALLPDYRDEVRAHPELTYYVIHVKVDLDPQEEVATLEGLAQIRYTNSSGIALDELVLMLWPNDRQYLAAMEAGPITIDGQKVEHEVELEGLALRVDLNPQLQSGRSVEVSLPFVIRTEGSIRNQKKRFGITNGTLIAPTFYPLIPRRVDGKWQAEIAPTGGDTTSSDMAYFEVSITASEEFEVIASGVEIQRQLLRDGGQSVTFVTGPMRDFAFALGKLEKMSKVVNGVDLNVWVSPRHEESGERMLNVATQQMGFLHQVVGPYPYAEFDIVDSPCSFGGIEYPGLVYICSMDTGYFVDTTVHEVAHQWFYGLIGNDQLHEPWLDESMATYWQVLYYEFMVGEDRANTQLSQYRSWVSRPEDQVAPIGLGIEDYRLLGDYYTIVYFKGALFLDVLRSELGEEDFFEFMKVYYQRYRYSFVDTPGFHEIAEEVCGCELDDLFNLWVYEGGKVFE